MVYPATADDPRVACDAMCGGLARLLRILGIDASYSPGIEDGRLVQHARDESRILISSDGKLFERRLIATGQVQSLRLPVGLLLEEQVRFVVQRLKLKVGFPRCPACNGGLARVTRGEVADVVPARSLIWAREFFRCTSCGHVYWEGSHWRNIGRIRENVAGLAAKAVNPNLAPTRMARSAGADDHRSGDATEGPDSVSCSDGDRA